MPMLAHLLEFDSYLLHAINVGWSRPWLDPIMVLLSSWVAWWSVAGFFALIALYRRRPQELRLAVAILLAVGLADFTSYYVLKPCFGRLRPCWQFNDVRQPSGCGSRQGFPSNHAANGMATTTVLAVAGTGPWAWASLALTLLVGLSRVYLSHHFPGDVVGGYLWGGTIGAIVGFCFFRRKRTRERTWGSAKTLYQ